MMADSANSLLEGRKSLSPEVLNVKTVIGANAQIYA